MLPYQKSKNEETKTSYKFVKKDKISCYWKGWKTEITLGINK